MSSEEMEQGQPSANGAGVGRNSTKSEVTFQDESESSSGGCVKIMEKSVHTAAVTESGRSEAMPARGPHMPTNEEEAHHVDAVYGKASWQARTLAFLHSKPVQYTLMGLLLLDVIILFVELFLDAQYPSCFTIVRDAISCCPEYGATAEDEAHRLLGGGAASAAAEGTCVASTNSTGQHRNLGGDEGYHAVCESGIDTPQCEAGCDEHKYDAVHRAHEALFIMTITILSTFMVELITMIICLTPCVFFKKVFYVLDFIVVTLSFALELFFHASNEETLQSLVGIIVMARLWRFVRIGHGLVGVTNEYSSKKHDKLVKYIEMLEAELEAKDIPLPAYREKIEKMKRLDSQHSQPSSRNLTDSSHLSNRDLSNH